MQKYGSYKNKVQKIPVYQLDRISSLVMILLGILLILAFQVMGTQLEVLAENAETSLPQKMAQVIQEPVQAGVRILPPGVPTHDPIPISSPVYSAHLPIVPKGLGTESPEVESAAEVVPGVPHVQVTPPGEEKNDPAPEREDKKYNMSYAFPEKVTRWDYLIVPTAKKYGLDPDLIAALIVQESGGNPDAYSRNGAVGLMQVMPRDGLAKQQFGSMFKNRPSMDELFDPAFNIDYGTRFLAALVDRNGSVRGGLFRYGPSGVGYSYADKVLAIYDRWKR
jgi:hypothetical protein